MMMERGVIVSYETIRAWCRTFGQAFANGLRRRRPRPGDKWYLDEVFIKIQGKHHYHKNNGKDCRPAGNPEKVEVHDFLGEKGKAVPYGVYDLGAHSGWVSVGTDHETAAFAVNTLCPGAANPAR
jgi:hypothetical protein